MQDEFKTKHPAGDPGWWWAAQIDDEAWSGPFAKEAEAVDDWWKKEGKDEAYPNYLVAGAQDRKASPDIAPDPVLTAEEFKAGHDAISEFRRPAISTDIFQFDRVLEELEDQNCEAVWDGCEPVWPKGETARELEKMLADALYRWMEKHSLWGEFRGLEGV
ncbi:MAG: hypothetical protein AAF468_12480 [Pseudomonadota bacterium]